MAGKEVNFDIVAKDKASKVLDQVADKAELVEKSDPTVDVKADTKQATHTLDGFADQLDRLTDDDKAVVVALRAGAAQTELRDLAADLAKIDAADPDVDVKFARYAEVSGQLDHLEAQLKDMGATGGADLGRVSDKLDGIAGSADKASGAVHSMAGNAAGDFAATATGIGPLGEGVGQLVEGLAGGELGMKGLITAGAGLGAVSAGMVVLNKVMGEFEKTAQRAAAIKAFNTADVDAYVKSLRAGTSVVDDYVNRIEAAGKLDVVAGVRTTFGTVGFKAVKDITDQLAEAGITVNQFAEAATGSADDLARFTGAVDQLGLSTTDANLIITAATTEHDNYAAAVERSAKFSSLFVDRQIAINAEAARWTGAAAAYQAATDRAGTAQKNLGTAAGVVNQALRDQMHALDDLRTNLSDEQAAYDLAAAFDAVRESSLLAEAAIRDHADNAAAALTQEAADTRALKEEIIKYGTEVLGLPDSQVVDVVTHVNDKELDQLEARLEIIKRNAVINAQIINRGGAGYGGTGQGGSGIQMVPSLSAAAAPARWARINGR